MPGPSAPTERPASERATAADVDPRTTSTGCITNDMGFPIGKPKFKIKPKAVPEQFKGKPTALSFDWASVRASEGSYAQSRKRARQANKQIFSKHIGTGETKHYGKETDRVFDEVIRLSSTTGRPTLNNPVQKQFDHRVEGERRKKRDAELEEVDRRVNAGLPRTEPGAPEVPPRSPRTPRELRDEHSSSVRGALKSKSLVACEANLSSLPSSLQNTFSLAIGLRELRLPRNKMKELKGNSPHISMRNLSHLVELDLTRNLLHILPTDIGLLLNLRELRLRDNRLAVLPTSFLYLNVNLKTLDLSKNIFKTLPDHFGSLLSLTALTLNENMLQELPSSFPRLSKLARLDLSKNGLPHLAIRAPLNMADVVSEEWEERVDPSTKQVFLVNTNTGEMKRAPKSSAKQRRVKNSRRGARGTENLLEPGAPAYVKKLAELAGQGVGEWDVVTDASAGSVYYYNNVTLKSSWDLPKPLDTFGLLTGLTHLKMNQNWLRTLPSSISRLTRLEVLEAKNNYLGELPDCFGKMLKLRACRLGSNELSTLPPSMVHCSSLTELQLTGNYFASLPAYVGRLTTLRKLMLGNNAVKVLPYSIGFLKDLGELQVFNNPLEDPPYELIQEGMHKLLYACRQKYWAQENGTPPVVAEHLSGIDAERIEVEPDFQNWLKREVKLAKRTGILELTQAGLRGMPPLLAECEELVTLKLNYNIFDAEPFFMPGAIALTLQVLWLKSCHIYELSPEFGSMRSLRELNLEDNRLTQLPANFSRLRRLETFNIVKNVLYDLPDAIGNLTALTKLSLDLNRLEYLPESISELRHLECLSASCNALYELPDSITELSKLTVLGLDSNRLNLLPDGMGSLSLQVLKCSHNRIEYLDDEFLAPTLLKTLRTLWVSSNNLVELPASIVRLEQLEDLHIEYNPMKSPPAELIAEGMTVVIQYCRLRATRITEIGDFLVEYGFDTDVTHFTPEAVQCITGNSGFLTPEDLQEFDTAVDTFVNGTYYLCPVAAAEIVDHVDEKRHQRQHVFYNNILTELLGVLHDECDLRERFDDDELIDTEMRGWGLDGEEVPCFAITLDALTKDIMDEDMGVMERPSLWRLTKRRLVATIFEYTAAVLKDALTSFEGPYGRVAALDKVKFGKKALAACVIERVIYSDQESRRRAEEADQFRQAFLEMEQVLDTWLGGRLGKRKLQQVVTTRTHERGELLNVKEGELKGVQNRLQAAEDGLDNAKGRKKAFEQGKMFALHHIETAEEAKEIKSAAELHLKTTKEETDDANAEYEAIRKKAKMSKREATVEAATDMKRKYCHTEYVRILNENRESAVHRNWRRPWDGEDGQAFRAWDIQQQNIEASGSGGALMGGTSRAAGAGGAGAARAEGGEDVPDWLREADEEDGDGPVYDWEGCATMSQYQCVFYDTYLDETKPEAGFFDRMRG